MPANELTPFLDDLAKMIADVSRGGAPARAFLLVAFRNGEEVQIMNQVFPLETPERVAALLEPLEQAGFMKRRGH